ncbi:MAG: hydroxymethylglutaryl-CoA lyase [Vampirovibrionales bacterium]|nr:hydroxymethylglutaryl-CoA lyase [Vampirovibrionales bacterium]
MAKLPSSWPASVSIVEVGPRDGLQNEARLWSLCEKQQLVEKLLGCGLKTIEVGAFVHPDRVPQMANSDALIAALRETLPENDFSKLSALVPNKRGLDRALASGIKKIAIFTAADDAFNHANIGMTVSESLELYKPVVKSALSHGLLVRGYISAAFVTPQDRRRVAPKKLSDVTQALITMGVHEVSIGDTTGNAVASQVEETLSELLIKVPANTLAMHFHDTDGFALANTVIALQAGITTFDSSVGGLGGCPYAPGAAGNLATEKLITMLDRMSIKTAVNTKLVDQVAHWVKSM